MSMRDARSRDGGEVLVDVDGITRSFGARVAISRLSLRLRAGQLSAMIGANGSGKSTSLRILAGLLQPDAGSGTILGVNVLQPGRSVRRHIGYLSQAFSLYPTLTAYENLRFRAEIFAVDRPRHAATQMLQEFALSEIRDVRADQLSGGWLRLLQLAATLIHRPRLVLLDEPTAGLDAVNRRAVWRHIDDLRHSGAGIVISTHELTEASSCTQIALLSGGVVQASGATEDVIAGPAAMALFGGQAA